MKLMSTFLATLVVAIGMAGISVSRADTVYSSSGTFSPSGTNSLVLSGNGTATLSFTGMPSTLVVGDPSTFVGTAIGLGTFSLDASKLNSTLNGLPSADQFTLFISQTVPSIGSDSKTTSITATVYTPKVGEVDVNFSGASIVIGSRTYNVDTVPIAYSTGGTATHPLTGELFATVNSNTVSGVPLPKPAAAGLGLFGLMALALPLKKRAIR